MCYYYTKPIKIERNVRQKLKYNTTNQAKIPINKIYKILKKNSLNS